MQALTSVVFTLSGLVGLVFFVMQYWRLAVLAPMIGTWGWRAIAENLRADHRGHTRISVYQVMSLIALSYLSAAAFIMPSIGPLPDLALGLSELAKLPVFLVLQTLWGLLFLFYGRSQVTASVLSFHVVTERT